MTLSEKKRYREKIRLERESFMKSRS